MMTISPGKQKSNGTRLSQNHTYPTVDVKNLANFQFILNNITKISLAGIIVVPLREL